MSSPFCLCLGLPLLCGLRVQQTSPHSGPHYWGFCGCFLKIKLSRPFPLLPNFLRGTLMLETLGTTSLHPTSHSASPSFRPSHNHSMRGVTLPRESPSNTYPSKCPSFHPAIPHVTTSPSTPRDQANVAPGTAAISSLFFQET